MFDTMIGRLAKERPERELGEEAMQLDVVVIPLEDAETTRAQHSRELNKGPEHQVQDVTRLETAVVPAQLPTEIQVRGIEQDHVKSVIPKRKCPGIA